MHVSTCKLLRFVLTFQITATGYLRCNKTNFILPLRCLSIKVRTELTTVQYTWSSISAGKWETQILALLEIRTISIQYRNITKTALQRILYCTIFALLHNGHISFKIMHFRSKNLENVRQFRPYPLIKHYLGTTNPLCKYKNTFQKSV